MVTNVNVRKRSIIYIDGFNLYYGAVRGTEWKWLDLQRYFERIRSADDIVEIAYFTALVEHDPPARARQEAYLSALRTLPKVNIIFGKYRDKTVRCDIACGYIGKRYFDTQEEKQTDVAIGVHMMDDAYRNRCDRLILVTGDGDVVPAIRMVRDRFPQKTVHVYVPARDPRRAAAKDVRDAASRHADLPLAFIPQSQLPNVVTTPFGSVSKPPEWFPPAPTLPNVTMALP